MQVASTLWPSRKSQKISEYRFRLKWTKCSPKTKAKQVKIGQPQCGSDKEAQTSPTPSSWGRLAARAGRPTYRSADQAHGPHRLNLAYFVGRNYTNLRRARARTPRKSHGRYTLVLLAKTSPLPFIATRRLAEGESVNQQCMFHGRIHDSIHGRSQNYNNADSPNNNVSCEH